jgi:hypothetical protein
LEQLIYSKRTDIGVMPVAPNRRQHWEPGAAHRGLRQQFPVRSSKHHGDSCGDPIERWELAERNSASATGIGDSSSRFSEDSARLPTWTSLNVKSNLIDGSGGAAKIFWTNMAL